MDERDGSDLDKLDSLAESVIRFSEENSGVAISDLVMRVSESEGVRFEKVARSLHSLWEGGRIQLGNTSPPEGAFGYLFSPYSAWFWLVCAALMSSLASLYLFPAWAPFPYIRIALGFISSLYLPGAALIEALYPKEEDLEELERFAVSVGVSVAVTPLVGLLLNYTPWGIRLDPLVLSLTGLTLILGLFGVWRKFTYFRLGVETIGMGARIAGSE